MIPRTAHFIWYGDHFPWVNLLAVRSALNCSGLENVVLHHDCDLHHNPHWQSLARLKGVETRRIESTVIFNPRDLTMRRLSNLHRSLPAASAKANILRAAILARYGGIYLDMDTVTIRSLIPLTGAGVFCGAERIAFPSSVVDSLKPIPKTRAIALAEMRRLCLLVPEGWRLYRRFERWYATAVNNAVLGAEPRHPFILEMLERMVSMEPKKQRVRFALGTHLLQKQVATYKGSDLVVHSPCVFYPLGPVISRHWFKTCRRPALGDIVQPDTRIVHWYASVRNRNLVDRIDPAFVQQHHRRQLFSALVFSVLN